MMKKIDKAWSHSARYENNDAIRASKPKRIASYSDLIRELAFVSYYNANLTLFFRGQRNDYSNKTKKTVLLPRFYRATNGKNLSKAEKKEKLNELFLSENCLIEKLSKLTKSNFYKKTGINKVIAYRDLQWAILKHYEVCDTPFLDITRSLMVACFFAFSNNSSDCGYLYVLGLPHVNDSISYHMQEGIVNVNLASIVMPTALRPHFQEAFLFGDFPIRQKRINGTFTIDFPQKDRVDCAVRLVAKYEIMRRGFWDIPINCLQEHLLDPKDDLMNRICDSIKVMLGKRKNSGNSTNLTGK